MRPSSKALPRLIAALCAATPLAALAHTGTGHVVGFLQGVAHPFTGIDHMLAMVAVGLLAGRLGGRATWLVPASFMSVMAVGALLGMARVAVPFVEIGIAGSILAFGLALASGRDMTVPATMALVGFFALFHGHAHGAEAAHDIASVSYEAGLLIASAMLHALGVFLALAANRHTHIGGRPLLRSTGGILVLAGVGVLAGLI